MTRHMNVLTRNMLRFYHFVWFVQETFHFGRMLVKGFTLAISSRFPFGFWLPLWILSV